MPPLAIRHCTRRIRPNGDTAYTRCCLWLLTIPLRTIANDRAGIAHVVVEISHGARLGEAKMGKWVEEVDCGENDRIHGVARK